MFMKKIMGFLAIILLNALILTGCGGGGGGGNSAAPEEASKDITSFKITNTDPASIGTLGPDTVTVIVPHGTDVSYLETDIVISGASVSPASGEGQDFSSPVEYTVTAADGSTKTYTVTVIVADSSEKNITSFIIQGTNPQSFGDVNQETKTITVTVPYGKDRTSLEPEISITGVSVSPANLEPVNFTNPVVYTVTAADGSTRNYTVTVTNAPFPSKDITKFTIYGRNGVIGTNTIQVTVPYNSDITSVVPEIGITGVSIRPSADVAQNFSSDVVYTVEAYDGSEKEYTVSVAVEPAVLGFSADGVSFNMVYVRGANNFPVLIDDSGRATVSSYRIGETEVTYALWLKVYSWAIINGYSFANAGAMGGGAGLFTDQHPVTQISWRDAIVWANAATEWHNAMKGTSYTPVYVDEGGNIIRDSRNASACDNAVARAANGFRLPTGNEWELAARLRNNEINTVAGFENPWFTKGDSASGATANHLNAAATAAVAVYSPSGSTAVVRSKLPNALGLYDMSGNVWEWCFELNGLDRFVKGGSYLSNSEYMLIGEVLTLPSNDTDSDRKLGLRLAKSE